LTAVEAGAGTLTNDDHAATQAVTFGLVGEGAGVEFLT